MLTSNSVLLKTLSDELQSRIDETSGTFGDVHMDYDDMYTGLYLTGEKPKTFHEVVVQCCGYSSPGECPQEEYWSMANELAYELADAPNDFDLDFEPDVWEMSADRKTLYVYLVNYKGEGEGYFKYDDVKSKIKGTYISKYNYV